MRKRLDPIFQETIYKAIDAQYTVNEVKQLIDTIDDTINSPEQLSETVMEMFGLSKDMADVITFNWLFENGFENIKENWGFTWFNGYHSTTDTVLSGTQLTFDYNEGFVYSGVSDTIVIGNNNTVDASDTIVLGDHNVVTSDYVTNTTFTGASLTSTYVM